jgi:hypothetical protein
MHNDRCNSPFCARLLEGMPPRTLLLSLCACAALAGNICGENKTLGSAVMGALNLSFPGLEAVAAAARANDLDAACEALAAYYAAANTSSWLRIGPVTPGTGRVGAGSNVDNAVDHDLYYMGGVDTSGVIPRNADGGLDWLNKGPRNDVEFMNCLNRFDVFGWLLVRVPACTHPSATCLRSSTLPQPFSRPAFKAAYQSTGNPVYTRYFDALVTDWATHNACPDALAAGGAPCSPQGVATYAQCSWAAPLGSQTCATGTFESPWRSLEMGIRTNGVFAAAFFGFQRAAEFSTSSRVLLILAMAEHNAALARDGGHPGRGTANWEIGQWSGLITSTVNFPELQNASGLQQRALAELEAVFASVVYPDGVETEMASGCVSPPPRPSPRSLLAPILRLVLKSPPFF